jgi:hypothetical protein
MQTYGGSGEREDGKVVDVNNGKAELVFYIIIESFVGFPVLDKVRRIISMYFYTNPFGEIVRHASVGWKEVEVPGNQAGLVQIFNAVSIQYSYKTITVISGTVAVTDFSKKVIAIERNDLKNVSSAFATIIQELTHAMRPDLKDEIITFQMSFESTLQECLRAMDVAILEASAFVAFMHEVTHMLRPDLDCGTNSFQTSFERVLEEYLKGMDISDVKRYLMEAS